MSKETGGSAFPTNTANANTSGACYPDAGMTLRDYFAAKAITGTLPGGAIADGDIARYASWAYRMADAMLVERAK